MTEVTDIGFIDYKKVINIQYLQAHTIYYYITSYFPMMDYAFILFPAMY